MLSLEILRFPYHSLIAKYSLKELKIFHSYLPAIMYVQGLGKIGFSFKAAGV